MTAPGAQGTSGAEPPAGDLERAVSFYCTLFGTEPAKRRPGYANFAIADRR